MSFGAVLVKILPSNRAGDFLDGHLYLNTSTYFGRIDATDIVRYDPHDGADEAWQVRSVEMQDSQGNWLSVGQVLGAVVVRDEVPAKNNILCLYSITDRPEDSFDQRNLSFGDAAILVENLSAFVVRLQAAAQAAGKSLLHGAVEYVDRASYHGRMGEFRKFSELSYQNEYRFVLTGSNGEACRLEVGNLPDIVRLMPSAALPDLWQRVRAQAR